jgi:hypothetical protein
VSHAVRALARRASLGPGAAVRPELAGLAPFDQRVQLELRSGDVAHLVTSSNPHVSSRRDTGRDALLEDLDARRGAWEASAEVEDVPALARSTRPALEWVAALRAIGAGEGGYRSAGVARERLWAVARSARATEDARAAAIVAVGAPASDDERRTLRELAACTASPRVRAVAEAVAEGRGEDAIARALSI